MLEIIFVSDYICPYCIVGKEALQQALQDTGIEARITYQPFEATEESAPRVDTYHDQVRREHYKVLEKPVRELGLDVKIPPQIIPRPYSRLAYEGYHYAKEHGAGEQYNDLIYKAYFTDEKDIGSIEVLSILAQQAGLNSEDFRDALERGTYYETEKNAVRFAKDVLKVTNIPTIFIDGVKLRLQEYTKEEWIRILTEDTVKSNGNEMAGCGVDGCTL